MKDNGKKTGQAVPDMATLLDSLQTPLWIFDIERVAMIWGNAAALALWEAEDLDALRSRDFSAEISGPVLTRLQDYLERFGRGEAVVETWTLYPQGRPTTLRCLCSGYPLENGLAMLVEAQPVVERDAEALRAQEALRHTPTLLSVFDAQGHLLSRNPAARATLSDGRHFGEYFVRSVDEESVYQWVLGNHESYSLEAPVTTRYGERWHRLDLQRTTDPVTGEHVVLVSQTDINARVENELALINMRERLSALLRNLRGGIVVEDENRRVVLANQTFCNLFGIDAPPEALEGADCGEAAEHSKKLFAEPDAFIEGIDAALKARQTVTDELEMVDGRALERTYVPVFHGEIYLGHLWQYWDITQQKRNTERLEHFANHDALTGLWNRRRFEQSLFEIHEESVRYGQPYSLIMIDIDHFKLVNDRYGHDAGDIALRLVAEEMVRRVRQVDRLARWGGEEFVLLLPQTSLDGALRLANILRTRVRNFSLPLVGGVTISLGVAEAGNNEMPMAVLKRADEKLLRAKANGRDRVEPMG